MRISRLKKLYAAVLAVSLLTVSPHLLASVAVSVCPSTTQGIAVKPGVSMYKDHLVWDAVDAKGGSWKLHLTLTPTTHTQFSSAQIVDYIENNPKSFLYDAKNAYGHTICTYEPFVLESEVYMLQMVEMY